MATKKLSLSFVLIFLTSIKIFSATFVVTSNADTGPGTLREAITLANNNGTSEIDYIHFNIGDVSRQGRTIVIQSGLPTITSNIQIDGTTQNGDKFGKSDAKIIIEVNTPQTQVLSILSIRNASNVEIYGLFLINSVFTLFSNYADIYGIDLQKSSNITIGTPNKGNYFRGLIYSIRSRIDNAPDRLVPNCENVFVYSNLFNVDESGAPSLYHPYQQIGVAVPTINPSQYAMFFSNAKNVEVGGEDVSKKNIFVAEDIVFNSSLKTNNGYIKILNNVSGVNTDGTFPDFHVSDVKITIQNNNAADKIDYDVSIRNNHISGSVSLRNLSKHFTLQGNTFFRRNIGGGGGSDFLNKVTIQSCSGGGLIGGELSYEQNVFYNTAVLQHYYEYSSLGTGAINISYSPKVAIIKNKLTCTAFYGSGIYILSSTPKVHVQIDQTETNFVKGKATPNSKIEVFKDDDCLACDGTLFLGETNSDANGDWSFTGNFSGTILATAYKDGETSEYSAPRFEANTTINHPTCDEKNGSITGIKLQYSTDNVEWHHTSFVDNVYIDTVVSRQVDLTNVGPGNYYFIAKLGNTCASAKILFTLYNYTPKIDESFIEISNPSCGIDNGFIRNLKFRDNTVHQYSSYTWIDENRNVLFSGRNEEIRSLENIGPGNYKLIVTDYKTACSDSTDWFLLENISGPVIDNSNTVITASNCGGNNGSIKGISILNLQTNDIRYEWKDNQNRIISNELDLLNQPSGKYSFTYSEEGGCPSNTIFYDIPDHGNITIIELYANVTPSGCTTSSGTVTSLTTIGAETRYWTRIEDNATVSTELDLRSQAAGSYQLTATNTFGCEKKSSIFIIPKAHFANIQVTGTAVTNAFCEQKNGSVTVNGFTNISAVSSYEWINNTNSIIGSGLNINNLNEGEYKLLVTDTNGCKETIFKALVGKIPTPIVSTNNIKITDDICEQKNGNITGIAASGLLGPTNYTWYNQNNEIAGNTLNLLNVSAGTYRLEIKDRETCLIHSSPLSVNNTNTGEVAPEYDDVIIQRNTPATLKVKNTKAGTYTLYRDAQGMQTIEKNESGIFQTPNLNADQTYYVRYNKGVCISPMRTVKVTVVDKSYFAIATGFTPNGDGHNERLNLKVIGYINVDFFQIYNRNGEMVFSTKTIEDGWNGKWKGVDQPTGGYVWIARGRDIQGNIITDKGTFVLIR